MSILPSALPGGGAVAGTYDGQVMLQTTGDVVTVPVSVTVGSSVFAQINGLTFTMIEGAPAPCPKT